MKFINENEFRVFGLRRSGHHAIINWIIGHYKNDPVVYVNDIGPHIPGNGVFFYYNLSNKKIQKEKDGKFLPKKVFLFNVEEERLDKIYDRIKIEPCANRGPSKEIYEVIVLRDPYNFFASRYKRALDKKAIGRYDWIDTWFDRRSKNLWKAYAKEFLGHTNLLNKNKKILISYNDWFLSRKYRKKISKIFSDKFDDSNYSSLMQVGGGSSFDGLSYLDNANKMDVLKRWEKYEKDEFYLNIFDKEMEELSREIFGSKIIGRRRIRGRKT